MNGLKLSDSMEYKASEARSRTMAAVHSKNTKPEVKIRKKLHALGLRYVLYDKRLPGKPDLVFPKYRTVVFIHGCFWHGHKKCNRKNVKIPMTNADYWEKKITRNIERNADQIKAIRKSGWRVLKIWECQISESSINKLYRDIRSY